MLDFNVIKFVDINTRTGKVLRPLPNRWEFPSPELTLMGLLRSWSCYLWMYFLWEYVLSLRLLKFGRLWLLSFIKLYML